jgi:hypothetical protein
MFEIFAANSKMFENFPAYSNFIFLKKFPPFQRCGSTGYAWRIFNMRHWYLNYQWRILVYAPRISLAEVRPVGPRWGPHVINGAFFIICATKRSNMLGAYNKCAIDKTWYFVDDPSGGSHMDISGAFWPICVISRKIISGAYLQMHH